MPWAVPHAAAGDPLPALMFSTDTTIDTGSGQMTPGGAAPGQAEAAAGGGPERWVIDASSVSVAAGVTLRFVGPRVPVIEASGEVSVAGTIALTGSNDAPAAGGGAGGGLGYCCSGFDAFLGSSGRGGMGAAGGGGGGYYGTGQIGTATVSGTAAGERGSSAYGGLGGLGGNGQDGADCVPAQGGTLNGSAGVEGSCGLASGSVGSLGFITAMLSSGGGGAGGEIEHSAGWLVGGSGGGGGASFSAAVMGGAGGSGGGAILISSATVINISGLIDANGEPGNRGAGGGGGGGGGAAWLRAPRVILGGSIQARAGLGGSGAGSGADGAIDIDSDCLSGSNNNTAPSATVGTYSATAAPPVVDDSYTLAEDTALSVSAPGVLGNDCAPAGAAATVVSGPAHGTVTLAADGSLVYTPDPNFNGADSFTYQASVDGNSLGTATVAVTVTPVNDPPVAAPDEYQAVGNAQLSVDTAHGVLANDTDVDHDALTAVLDTQPGHGTVTLAADGSFSYTPAPGYLGTDSFTYQAFDGTAMSEPATVSIDVLAPAPTLTATVQQPVNADGSSVFTAKRGVIPIKFTLQSDGAATCQLPPATITVTRLDTGT
ncbi:MAG: tandem-95 repeat protein, partial [Mycobacterium sp.]|nr:tandem-95 repeat protein [Mycobacterium sp.]